MKKTVWSIIFCVVATAGALPAAQTQGEALKRVQQAIVDIGGTTPDYGRIYDVLDDTIDTAYPDITPSAQAAIEAKVTCCRHLHYWHQMARLDTIMLRHHLTPEHPEDLVQAELKFGRTPLALKVARRLESEYPGNEALIVAEAQCSQQQDAWQDSLAALQRVRTPTPDYHRIKHEALLHLGNLAEAEAELTHLPASDPDLPRLRQRLAIVTRCRLIVDREVQTSVCLGIYHLLGKAAEAGPLVRLRVYNLRPADLWVRFEAGIPGVTDKTHTTSMLLHGGARQEISLTPPLLASFEPRAVQAERPASLAIKLTEQSTAEVLYDKSIPVTIYPRDYLPMRRLVGEGTGDYVLTTKYVAAWVTPNAPAVDPFLKLAKHNVKHDEGSMPGDDQDQSTLGQVEAIYKQLQSEGMSYVNDPNVPTGDLFLQRTRLPSEVLAVQNAQCLEGTLLFSTLMEAVHLSPVVVIVPHHAFVGWHANQYDIDLLEKRDAGVIDALPRLGDARILLLETTMVHDNDFAAACRSAEQEYVDEARRDADAVQLIDISSLRNKGFTPQPSDHAIAHAPVPPPRPAWHRQIILGGLALVLVGCLILVHGVSKRPQA